MNPSPTHLTLLLVLFAAPFSLAQQSPSARDVVKSETVYVAPPRAITKDLIDVTTLTASAEAEKKLSPDLALLLAQAREKTHSGDFDTAISLTHQALAARPHEALFWITLGDAQCWAKSYAEAVVSYTNAIASPIKTANGEQLIAAAENNIGAALAPLRRSTESTAAFEAAAKLDPPKAAIYFTHEAFIVYGMGIGDPVEAADKAIAADPTLAPAYYIRAEALLGKTTIDRATNRFVFPPGCIESFQRYLQLEPHGEFAQDAGSILVSFRDGLGSSTKYRPPPKTAANNLP